MSETAISKVLASISNSSATADEKIEILNALLEYIKTQS